MPPAKLGFFSKTGILGRAGGYLFHQMSGSISPGVVCRPVPCAGEGTGRPALPGPSCSIQPLGAPANHAVCWAGPAAAARRDKAEAKPKEKMECVLCQGFDGRGCVVTKDMGWPRVLMDASSLKASTVRLP